MDKLYTILKHENILDNTDFHGLKGNFSTYNDWTLLIDMDVNESWNLIKNIIYDGMVKFIPRITLKTNKEHQPKWIHNKVKRCLQRNYMYYIKYLCHSRKNYTTDGVTCGGHYEAKKYC